MADLIYDSVIADALEAAGAPRRLVELTAGVGDDEVLDQIVRPDWLVWVWAAGGMPLGALLSYCLEGFLTLVPDQSPLPAVRGLLTRLRSDDPQRVAKEAEQLVHQPPQHYRQSSRAAMRSAEAVASLAHATDALGAAIAGAQAQDDLDAMFRASSVGVSPEVMGRSITDVQFDPHSDDPWQQNAGYVVEAAARACAKLVAALGESRGSSEAATALTQGLLAAWRQSGR
ncbi:MAG: hypothetical protein AAGA56_10140 [Myxococcota bacterium]